MCSDIRRAIRATGLTVVDQLVIGVDHSSQTKQMI